MNGPRQFRIYRLWPYCVALVLALAIAALVSLFSTGHPFSPDVLRRARRVASALECYAAQHGGFPTGIYERIVAELMVATNANGYPFLVVPQYLQAKERPWDDPWGRPYSLFVGENGLVLMSLGPNGRVDLPHCWYPQSDDVLLFFESRIKRIEDVPMDGPASKRLRGK